MNILSVIIPCYNNGKYLIEMIDCFRHQTSSCWEMIIVDDGSTDDTPQVVEKSIIDIPNVHFYRRDRNPKGSVVCRNIGFEKAKGKYICHLDADDLVSPTFVEHRVAFMENHPDVDYASFPAKRFNNPQELPKYEDEGYTWGVGDGNDDLLLCFMKGYDYPFSVWNNIYKRESIANMPWDENVRIYTDFSFIVPSILAGLKHEFSGLKEVDYFYRTDVQNKVAMTSNFASRAKCESTNYLFSKTLDSLIDIENSKKYKKEFFKFALVHLQRIVMSQDANFKENVESYINMCGKYYHCKRRFRLIANLNKIDDLIKRQFILSILYCVLFGYTHFLSFYFESFKRKFYII